MSNKILDLHFSNVRWILILSYLIALTLDTMVLLNQAKLIVPPLTLFLLLYWSAQFINRTHLFSALILGLLADTLYQTTLGSHSLLFIIITFMMVRHRLRFRTYPLWQQSVVIGIYLLIYQGLNTVFFAPVLDDSNSLTYWAMPLMAIVLWPIISYTLRTVTQKIAVG